MINTANVAYVKSQNSNVAFHNCNSPQSFQECMQKPKEHIYNKPTQQSNWKHHNMEVSCVQFVWCIIRVSWKFRLIHRFRYLKCCWSSSSQVFDACSADVQSGLAIKQYHAGFLGSLITSYCTSSDSVNLPTKVQTWAQVHLFSSWRKPLSLSPL